VVYITGAGSGIGRSFAEHLAKRGATLVVNDLDLTSAEETAARITNAGGKATASKLDVCDAAGVKASIDEAFATHKRLDYVFGNAGVGVFGELHLLEDRDWDTVLGVNLHGVVHTVRAAYPHLMKQGFGPRREHRVARGSARHTVSQRLLHGEARSRGSLARDACRGPGARSTCQRHLPRPTRTPILTAGSHGHAREESEHLEERTIALRE